MNLVALDCFNCPRLVFGGDLNFSLGLFEVWGVYARLDPLSDFFSKLLEGLGFIDIAPLAPIPT